MEDFIKKFNDRIRRAYGFSSEAHFNKVKHFNEQIDTRNKLNREVEGWRGHGEETHYMSERLTAEVANLDK